MELEHQQTQSLNINADETFSNDLTYMECLAQEMPKLARAGGMQFINSLIQNAGMMNPRKKASYSIFLTDNLYEEARKELSMQLDVWINLLSKDVEDTVSITEYCREQAEHARDIMAENLEQIHQEARQLEISYRTIDTFFKNTEKKDVDFLSIVHVDKKQLTDSTSATYQFVERKLHEGYDAIDLGKNYSLLVVPNILSSETASHDRQRAWSVVMRSWAQMVHHNKALLITDFDDCNSYRELLMRLDEAHLQDTDIYLSDVVMTCSYVLGRRKSDISEEYDDLYIPSSAALAGRMTNIEHVMISQGIAGQKYGCLIGVPAVRFNLLKSELSLLIDKGVVPLVELDGRVIAFSNRTLYAGPVLGLQEYPIVRVFDWVSKVVQHLCHEHALIVWDSALKDEMTENLKSFLDKYKGAGKLYENYVLKEIEQEPATKNIIIKLELKPFFAAKNFLIELTGKNVNNSMQWQQDIQ